MPISVQNNKTGTIMHSSKQYITITSIFITFMLIFNSYLPAYAVTIVPFLYILYYVITNAFSIPRELISYLAIPSILILLGISSCINNDLYDVLKDGWYYITPFVVFSAGYLTAYREKNLYSILTLFVLYGWLLSLFHLVNIVTNPDILFKSSVETIRHTVGRGYFLSVVSLVTALYARRKKLQLLFLNNASTFIYIVITIDCLSIVLSFSRTLWISFLLAYLITGEWLTLKRPSRLILAGMIILALNISFLVMPKDQLSPNSMTGKLVNSFNEVLISDYFVKADIQRNWRGYEAYMAWRTYLEGGVVNIVAGHGFGKLIDLKIYMDLGGNVLRYIPVLHNGYLYLLVKTGIVGLALYLIYLFQILQIGLAYSKTNDNQLEFVGKLIIGFVLVLLFTTFVVSGIFNKGGFVPLVLMIGILLGYGKIRTVAMNPRDPLRKTS